MLLGDLAQQSLRVILVPSHGALPGARLDVRGVITLRFDAHRDVEIALLALELRLPAGIARDARPWAAANARQIEATIERTFIALDVTPARFSGNGAKVRPLLSACWRPARQC